VHLSSLRKVLRRPLRGPWKAASLVACLAAASAGLAGCQSTLSTNVAVTKSSATITVHMDLTSSAAAVIARTPSLQTELNHVLSVRMGTPEHATVTPSLVSWTGTLTYHQLIENANVLGVGALSQAPSGSGVRVSVGLVDPTGLDAALVAGAKGQPAPAALLITMEKYTNLSVTIEFPGAATLVSSSGVTPVVEGNTATVTQSVFDFHPGAFVVDGSLSSGLPLYWWAVGLVVVAGLVYFLGRRRR
jgi:hypothetical protein